MAIALVASVSTGLGASGGTTGAINTTGATLIVISVASSSAYSAVITDSKGNTYTGLTFTTYTGIGQRIFYVTNPTVGTGHTFNAVNTAGTSSFYAAILIYAFSGTNTFHSQNTGISGPVGPLDCGSVTPSTDGSLVFTGMTGDSPATDIPPAGFTGQTVAHSSGNNYQGSSAYLIQTTAAAINPQWSWSVGSHYAAGVVAVFIPTVSAPTTNESIQFSVVRPE